MLVAVLSLGGAILGATTVAGLLTLYQIRATTDTENSAKAIFAADAGAEWVRFDHYCSTDVDPSSANGYRCEIIPGESDYDLPTSTFSGNGVTMQINCYSNTSASGATVSCSDTSMIAAITSGISFGSERAFYTSFSTSTPNYP